MQLGKSKNNKSELMKTLQKENVVSRGLEEAKQEVEAEPQPSYNPLLENVAIEVEEKVTCSVSKDGDVGKFEVKGIVYLTINDPKKCAPVVKL